MAERAEFVKRFYGEETVYEGPVDYDRKPGPLTRVRRGMQQELNRYENGGAGNADERVIRPAQRYAPPQMDKGDSAAPAPSPAPLPLEPTDESAPGMQQPAQPAPPPPVEPKPNPGE